MGTVTVDYIAAGCNCAPAVADCSPDGVLSFGSCHSLCLARADPPADLPSATSGDEPGAVSPPYRVLSTLAQHSSNVTCCRWARCGGGDTAVATAAGERRLCVTGAVDGAAILWTLRRDLTLLTWHRLSAHTAPVTHVDAVCVAGGGVAVVTTAADHQVCVWRADGSGAAEPVLAHSLHLQSRLALSVHVCVAPSARLPAAAAVCVLVGLDDCSVQVWSAEPAAGRQTEAGTEPLAHRVATLSGHKDWVRCIDSCRVAGQNGGQALYVASGSQDHTVRVWRIEPVVSDAAAAAASDVSLSVKSRSMRVAGEEFGIRLESVLTGHAGWVYGARWLLPDPCGPARLLTASMDNFLLVWTERQSVWVESARLGSSGAHSHGFYGCCWLDRRSVMAHDFRGAVHIWRQSAAPGSAWLSQPAPSGHFGAVTDLAWSPSGRYLLSCSVDKTTRLHAQHRPPAGLWHEYFRPQVHGHELSCVAFVDDSRFVSGGEEKLARAFCLPPHTARQLSAVPLGHCSGHLSLTDAGTALSSLGLTNKTAEPDESAEAGARGECGERAAVGALFAPPTAESLANQLLWPELRKLYGHANELHCLAVTPTGGAAGGATALVASACRATSAEHASPLLWTTDEWRQTGAALQGGSQLTIIQMAFSPDARHLLTVSRDRSWSVFGRDSGSDSGSGGGGDSGGGGGEWVQRQHWARAHARVLWCCAWLPDAAGFVTGSRDATVRTWLHQSGDSTEWRPAGDQLSLPEPVTALCVSSSGLMAVGTESGCIHLMTPSPGAGPAGKWGVWGSVVQLCQSAAHHLTVRRLCFRPSAVESSAQLSSTRTQQLQLASAGNDGIVKIHTILLDS